MQIEPDPAAPVQVEPAPPPSEAVPPAPVEPAPVEPAPAEPPPPGPVPPTPGAAVGPAPGPLKGVVKELRRGPLLIYGNYCGIGNRPGAPPVDALDEACMRHDACTKTGKLPSCACDDRLRVEATLVAKDPRTPPDVQAVALATATAMELLICKVTPRQ